MIDHLVDRITRQVELIWKNSGAWPEFTLAMRQALFSGGDAAESGGQRLSRWLVLPGYCCQAAGGDPLWAGDITAAWAMFQTAAHLIDSVQDGDRPDPWWAALGPGVALGAATGLIFSGSLALNLLHAQPGTAQAAGEISTDFHRSFLQMCSGQHADLLQPEPSLEQYWQIAAAKTGVFFALGCRSGARMATDDRSRLEAYSRFGHHLGFLIQLRDDLEDLRLIQACTAGAVALPELTRTFAAVYALSVYPPEQRQKLRSSLAAAADDPQAAQTAQNLIDSSGAGLYLLAEVERHRERALAALDEAVPDPQAGARLSELVHMLAQFKDGGAPKLQY